MGSLSSPENYFYITLIIFLDIKPNNILVDYEEDVDGSIIIKNVQISDLEDGVIIPPGKWLRGPLCGNAMWRSPESWCRSRQNQASDVFSFGIVVWLLLVLSVRSMFLLHPAPGYELSMTMQLTNTSFLLDDLRNAERNSLPHQ